MYAAIKVQYGYNQLQLKAIIYGTRNFTEYPGKKYT